ncbi:MAG: pyridoxamine 5'-phosphate oxidase family protein [Salibacteraceae bacterium]
MATFETLSSPLIEFIKKQKMFFVATAPKSGRINLSPKGLESFYILNESTVYWLNLTGSGNETEAHLSEDNRMTIMFNSFDENPLILRLYGMAKSIRMDNELWNDLISNFPAHPGARQIIEMKIDLVQTSCGYGVPEMKFVKDRGTLNKWATEQGDEKVRDYWDKENRISLDGKRIEGF